jgi:hypothetical protein
VPTDIPEDDRVQASRYQEMIDRVKALVDTRYSGDWKAAFAAYAGQEDKLTEDGVKSLLKDAGVGTFVTRGVYAKAVVDALDQDKDGAVSVEELEAEFSKAGK